MAWITVPTTDLNGPTSSGIASNAQLGPSGGFTVTAIGATLGYTFGTDITAPMFGSALIDLTGLCPPGSTVTPTVGSTIGVRVTVDSVGNDDGGQADGDGTGSFVAQGAQSLPPTVVNPPTTGDIQATYLPAFSHVAVRGYGTVVSLTDTQPDTGQIQYTVQVDPTQPAAVVWGGSSDWGTTGLQVLGVTVEVDDTTFTCETPPIACPQPVTVCNPNAQLVPACHNGQPVVVEWAVDLNGRAISSSAGSPYGGRVLDLAGNPIPGVTVPDGVCPAPVVAPAVEYTGGVSIAEGSLATAFGPDGTNWSPPGPLLSVTVAARTSTTVNAVPGGVADQVIVSLDNAKIVLLNGETFTWSATPGAALNTFNVSCQGDSAALVVWVNT